MFNATLEAVGHKLAQTEAAIEVAIRQLSAISGLTWHTEVGRAFTRRSELLEAELSGLLRQVLATQSQLAAARTELDELEERIMRLHLAG